MTFFESELSAKDYILSQFMESFLKDSFEAIKATYMLFKDNDISFIFIGGVARNLYANPRMTMDLDLLVDKEDEEKVKNLPIGYIRDLSGRGKRMRLHEPQTPIDIIYTGERAGDNNGIEYKIENIHYEKGFPFLSLEDLVMYKLSSGIYGNRLKDFGDIQDLIRDNNLGINYADSFREDLKNKYIEIWNMKVKEIK